MSITLSKKGSGTLVMFIVTSSLKADLCLSVTMKKRLKKKQKQKKLFKEKQLSNAEEAEGIKE